MSAGASSSPTREAAPPPPSGPPEWVVILSGIGLMVTLIGLYLVIHNNYRLFGIRNSELKEEYMDLSPAHKDHIDTVNMWANLTWPIPGLGILLSGLTADEIRGYITHRASQATATAE